LTFHAYDVHTEGIYELQRVMMTVRVRIRPTVHSKEWNSIAHINNLFTRRLKFLFLSFNMRKRYDFN